MKIKFLIAAVAAFGLSQLTLGDVCQRSPTVRSALVGQLAKPCQDITDADLATVTTLKLPHIHLVSFLADDFAGLDNLVKLEFMSLFHKYEGDGEPPAFDGQVFAKLPKLEELFIMSDQLGVLPDDAFAGLVSLKKLTLLNCELNYVPTSLYTLPNLEEVNYGGAGLTDAQYEEMKQQLGTKLKN